MQSHADNLAITRQYIDDHDLVARYLAGQLSEEERQGFEAYFLDHPEVLRELNRTAQLKSGLMDLRNSGELGQLLQLRPWWQRSSSIAIAASLVLVVLCAGVLFNLTNAPRPVLASSPAELTHRFQSMLPVIGAYDLQRTRTSSYDASVELPSASAAIQLRIKPEMTAPLGRYRVSLGIVASDDTVTRLSTIGRLEAAPDGFVPVYLNSSELRSGVYELGISDEADADPKDRTSVFLIEFTAANNR